MKKLRSCGHRIKSPCHMSPENIECFKGCLKTLECGHACANFCYANCGPCLILVEKKIQECGHYIQVPCYDSYREPLRADCYSMCKIMLTCGHRCRLPCKNIFCRWNSCEEYVNAIGTCGHMIARPCHEEKRGSFFAIYNEFDGLFIIYFLQDIL
jgi:hypothetical protein